MSGNEKILEYENVNGIILSLKVDLSDASPHSRLFTVSYKSKENKSSWPKMSLGFAVLFNIMALCYVKISLTATAIILIVLSFLIFFWISHSVQSESVLVIPTVGIQNSVKYVYGREDNFIPWTNIDDVIINEVIKLNRVIFYLTVLMKNNNEESEPIKLIPLFKYTKPRLRMLEMMYSELQSLLSEMHSAREPFSEAGDMG